MERFRKYMGKDVNLENVKDSSRMEAYGIKCTYFSDPLEDFDELEFNTDFNGKNNIVITVTTEMGKIKRILFSVADEKAMDVIKSMTESEMENFLARKGEQLVSFFECITI